MFVSIGVYMIEESFMENKKTETSVSASIFDCETIETVEKVFPFFFFILFSQKNNYHLSS